MAGEQGMHVFDEFLRSQYLSWHRLCGHNMRLAQRELKARGG